MSDSNNELDSLKAEIFRRAQERAQKEVEELERAAEIAKRHNLRLVRADANDLQIPMDESDQRPAAGIVREKDMERNDNGVAVGGSLKSTATQGKPVRHEKSWTQSILEIARVENRGLTHAELKAEVAKTDLGQRLNQTEAAFYGGLGKLKSRGKLIYHKGRFYTPTAFAQFQQDVEAGLVKDTEAPAAGRHRSPAKRAILEFMATRRSAETPAILKMLKSHPETKESVEKNTAPVYNLLNRMAKRGELVKRGKRYSLPSKKDEAPTGEPEGASVNGRADPLLFENRDVGFRRTIHG